MCFSHEVKVDLVLVLYDVVDYLRISAKLKKSIRGIRLGEILWRIIVIK